MAKELTNEQKAARKIRQQIRKEAKLAGISTDEYRKLHGITAATIRHEASDGHYTPAPKPKAISKPVAIDPNRPKNIIVPSGLYPYSFLMELADNGHYLPKEKIYG